MHTETIVRSSSVQKQYDCLTMRLLSSRKLGQRFCRAQESQGTQLLPARRDSVNLKGETPEAAKSKGKNKDMSKKAVLLSGPPGIGKSSSAMIITRRGVNCQKLLVLRALVSPVFYLTMTSPLH